MGLIDRDYARREDRQRSFSQPPGRSSLGMLGMALIFIAVLFALYKMADWRLQQSAAQRAVQPVQSVERADIKSAKPAPRLQQPQQNAAVAGTATQRVTKCVINGKTSYGDGPCTPGATVSQIVTRSDHNLMAAVRPQSAITEDATDERPAPRRAVVQNTSAVDTAAFKKAECKTLDARVEYLDSMSRQPQAAQTQDWIRNERKKARDRQFSLSCP